MTMLEQNKINYLGKKTGSGIPRFIISKMPKHDIYIEPFLGTGSIMSLKEKANINIGIDLDISILHQLKIKSDYTILNGNSLIFLKYLIDTYNYIESKQQKILIYLDPPYLPETRTSFNQCNYKHELMHQEHIQLCKQLKEISMQYQNVFIMLSGYKSNLYMSMLPGAKWFYYETQTMSRGGKRIESLWTNFNPNNYIKHDYNYVGQNYTDSQRIKRKANRWVDNLEKLPLDEREYIFKMISHSQEELYSSIDIS